MWFPLYIQEENIEEVICNRGGGNDQESAVKTQHGRLVLLSIFASPLGGANTCASKERTCRVEDEGSSRGRDSAGLGRGHEGDSRAGQERRTLLQNRPGKWYMVANKLRDWVKTWYFWPWVENFEFVGAQALDEIDAGRNLGETVQVVGHQWRRILTDNTRWIPTMMVHHTTTSIVSVRLAAMTVPKYPIGFLLKISQPRVQESALRPHALDLENGRPWSARRNSFC